MRAITYRRFAADEARKHRDTVEHIYTRSYVDAINSGDPFDSIESFMLRFDSYAAADVFDMVVAYADSEPVGQTWGWPLRRNALWWTGLQLDAPDSRFTEEDGQRTFALSEIMVDANVAGRGIARGLHDTLLSARREERATLLVEPGNPRARRAYLHWGWTRVGQLRPRWDDAPLFEVMVLPLRGRRSALQVVSVSSKE